MRWSGCRTNENRFEEVEQMDCEVRFRPVKISLVGDRFGRLLVIGCAKKIQHKSSSMRAWICLCDCGIKCVKGHFPLVYNMTKSCGCLRREVSKTKSLKAPGVSGLRSLIRSYRESARVRDIVYTLTENEFARLTKKCCWYCGTPPVAKRLVKGSAHTTYTYNGLDRKLNSRGYIFDNVVPCCWPCNRMKRETPIGKFLTHIHLISSRHRR